MIRYRNVPDHESREYIFNLYRTPLHLDQIQIYNPIKQSIIAAQKKKNRGNQRNQFTQTLYNNELVTRFLPNRLSLQLFIPIRRFYYYYINHCKYKLLAVLFAHSCAMINFVSWRNTKIIIINYKYRY